MAKIFISNITDKIENDIEKTLQYLEWEKIIAPGSSVFLKPNLTFPTYEPGITTSPEFIEGVVKVISSRTNHIMVGESDGGYRGWPAEMAFEGHNLPAICKRYGVKLINLSKQPCIPLSVNLTKGLINLNLPAVLLNEVDVFITLPVPKIHQVTYMSGAIKNQWGCIPDTMRLLNHPYFDELILEINRLLKVRLALADGKFFLNKTGPMLNGIPILKNLIIGSDSIGSIDSVLCRIMGLNYREIRYLRLAEICGWIPPIEDMEMNTSPEDFCNQKFYLKRTLRSSVVSWAFDHPWAVNLIWNSSFGNLFHKLLYSVAGNPVHDTVKKQDEKDD